MFSIGVPFSDAHREFVSGKQGVPHHVHASDRVVARRYEVFLEVDLGWYQLISVLDDHPQKILARKVKANTTSTSLSELGEQAGMVTASALQSACRVDPHGP
jgi:hypothetical protein